MPKAGTMDTSVVVFDDNATRRKGLQLMINSTSNMVCTGAFEDCSHVMEDIETAQPDVILMDIDMPHVNGIEGVKKIREKYPDIKILMQTVFEDDDKIFAAICAGADGYILKKTPPQKLIDAITEALEGGAPMTPSVAKQVLILFSKQHKKGPAENFDLSKREQEILSLLVQGFSYKMIAEKCFISFSTVNTHITRIYEKLHVHSATEAVAKAIDKRIV